MMRDHNPRRLNRRDALGLIGTGAGLGSGTSSGRGTRRSWGPKRFLAFVPKKAS